MNPIAMNIRLSLGGKLYLWQQPELFSENSARAKSKTGILCQVNSEYKIRRNITTLFNIGYKTKGFIQGSSLNSSIVFEGGLKLVI